MATIPIRLLRIADSAAHHREISDDEIVAVAVISRLNSGPALLWTDPVTTYITIGGGAAQEQISIGGATTVVTLNANVVVEQTRVSRTGALRVGAGGGFVTTLSGLTGAAIQFNDGVDLDYDPELLEPTLVGVLNELLGRPATALEKSYTNANAGTLAVGTPVYMVSNTSVDVASAAADTLPANFLGLLQESTLTTALGRVATSGRRLARFAAGEGVGPHVRKEVFLSTTAGFCTLVAPSGSGQVVVLVGFVADDSAYNNGTGGTMVVEMIRDGKRVLP